MKNYINLLKMKALQKVQCGVLPEKVIKKGITWTKIQNCLVKTQRNFLSSQKMILKKSQWHSILVLHKPKLKM